MLANAVPKPDPTETNEDARAFIRRCACWRCRVMTGALVYGCEAAHVRAKRNNGDLANLIPLCKKCHRFQHQIGIQSFERNVGESIRPAAAVYWQAFLVGRVM